MSVYRRHTLTQGKGDAHRENLRIYRENFPKTGKRQSPGVVTHKKNNFSRTTYRSSTSSTTSSPTLSIKPIQTNTSTSSNE